MYWELTQGLRGRFALGAAALVGVDLLELVPPLAMGLLIDSVTQGSPGPWSPLAIAMGYIGTFALQSAIRYPMRMGLIGASTRAVARLRQRYADHLLRVRRSDLTSFSTGDLMTRASSDLGAVEGALSSGLLFLIDCLFHLLTVPAAVLWISPRLCLYALPALALIPVAAQILVRRVAAASEEVQEAFGRLTERAHEHVLASESVRALGLEEREIDRFEDASDRYVANDFRRVRLEILFSGSVQILIAVSVFAILLLGGRQVLEGRLTPGSFVTFLQYMGMMAWPLSGLAWAFLLFRKGEAGLRRISEILELPSSDSGCGEKFQKPRGTLECRHLSFTHPGSTRPVLCDVTFSIQAGEKVALLGPIGGGKSTLIDLITRMVDPPEGTVFIDGVDVRRLDADTLRRSVAVATTDAFLFSGTIRDNVAVGSDNPAHIRDAAEAARVRGDEFAGGLDTAVGEKGASLSGGQRQRVSLARALARKPSILILDDASSALDAETEEELYRHLPLHAGGATVLFATHRMRRAREADRILVLEGGRIAEQGSPQELLAANGTFAAWVRKQALCDELDQP
jgi:ATP-binding cassette subfamily B protein